MLDPVTLASWSNTTRFVMVAGYVHPATDCVDDVSGNTAAIYVNPFWNACLWKQCQPGCAGREELISCHSVDRITNKMPFCGGNAESAGAERRA